MKVKELMRKLKEFDENLQVVIREGESVYSIDVEAYRADLSWIGGFDLFFIKEKRAPKGKYLILDVDNSSILDDKDLKPR